MWKKTERADPEASTDPALGIALRELRWFRASADRARLLNRTSEILLLVLSAATTVAAGLGAAAWLTATLAAASVVVIGLRKTFDWHENWVTFIGSWLELRALVDQYRLLPVDGRTEQARRRLVADVAEVTNAETERWTTRRRKLSDAAQQF